MVKHIVGSISVCILISSFASASDKQPKQLSKYSQLSSPSSSATGTELLTSEVIVAKHIEEQFKPIIEQQQADKRKQVSEIMGARRRRCASLYPMAICSSITLITGVVSLSLVPALLASEFNKC